LSFWFEEAKKKADNGDQIEGKKKANKAKTTIKLKAKNERNKRTGQ
jgi:hypothetical protein